MNTLIKSLTIILVSLVLSFNLPEGNMEKAKEVLMADDYATTLKELRILAGQNDPEALFALGWMYEHGKGVEKNDKEAARWYIKSANRGYPDAQSYLSFMYFNGKGVKQDYTEALKWDLLAANQGYADSQFSLGTWYLRGDFGVVRNYKEATRLWSLAAYQGHGYAQEYLGRAYLNGEGVEEDDILGYAWLSIAAVSKFEAKNEAMALDSLKEEDMTLSQIKQIKIKIEELKKSIKLSN